MKHIIVGTAGHVDHGKTEIIKALTGRDTDRLAEEKKRGISIVLGFAPLELSEDVGIGVVDVPGHEKFVKNMVSGATGVDIVLLVIAGDEGVMPQTREHFEALRLLGIDRGIVVISKTDLVDTETADVVESEVMDLLEGTPLEDSPVVRTSVVSGEGLEELKSILNRECLSISERKKGGFFRMPVDRVFTLPGIGTIITGTTWSGEVRVGDTLAVEPAGLRARVRELQTFDRSVERAGAGMRVALALHGVGTDEISPGDQVLEAGKLMKTSMLDVYINISGMEGSAIKQRQRLRFHHAAGEIMCRARLMEAERIERGQGGFVQLRLEEPTVAVRGDRFILRRYSPMRVIAGGEILDPDPRKLSGRDSARVDRLRVYRDGNPEEVLMELIAGAGIDGFHLSAAQMYGFTGQETEETAEKLEGEGRIIRLNRIAAGSERIKDTAGKLREIVDSFMRENPLVWGIKREVLKRDLGIGNEEIFDYLLEKGKDEGWLFMKQGMIRAGSAEREFGREQSMEIEKIENAILEAGFEFRGTDDIRAKAGTGKNMEKYLHILKERGVVIEVTGGSYLHSDNISGIREKLAEHFRDQPEMSIGNFKGMTDLSRKYAVPLLEYLDMQGVTERKGDVRVAGKELREREI